MAFDGIMMTMVRREMSDVLIGSRVNQIYQPARDELVFAFRTQQGTKKVLIRLSDSPRIHISSCSIENPPVPPMLCMLLRKRLGGAKLSDITQPKNERVLCLHFEALNEIGDREKLKLYIEIMGRYSNAVLTDGEDRVIDTVRRIDFSVSEERVLLPKMPYELPRMQDKLCIEENEPETICERIEALGGDDRAALNTIQGISPMIAREICYRAERDSMLEQISALKKLVEEGKGEPTLIYRADGSPMDFVFMDIRQYEGALTVRRFETFGELLDTFFSDRDRLARMKAKSADIGKLLNNGIDRLSRKINLQRADLKKCADREQLRIKGDLLQANLYRIERGATSVTVENFYDENNATVTIKLDPTVSPAMNAQRCYKEYNKAKTREIMLTEQIQKATEELAYLESVQEMLSRCESEAELSAIREELREQGFIKTQKGTAKRKDKPLPPIEYESSDGFRILVGRNNKQNDQLTLRTANKNDLWLHTKEIHGSHVIIVADGKEISDTAIMEAARIAAMHSKGKDSAQVPVDYTRVKNVSKPNGALPGKVIYVNYNTVYVTPGIPS
ncbi:NFACT family protein [Ruminococcus sp.]|uniref:Rqc2 family fibronectin-binding protein n=1 Tax=Ruminococcus sp. TaxID=41978 RepID=UPI00386C38C6